MKLFFRLRRTLVLKVILRSKKIQMTRYGRAILCGSQYLLVNQWANTRLLFCSRELLQPQCATQVKLKKVASAWLKKNYKPVTVNSVLLFCARPVSVVLSATGFDAPKPFQVKRLASMPLLTR